MNGTGETDGWTDGTILLSALQVRQRALNYGVVISLILCPWLYKVYVLDYPCLKHPHNPSLHYYPG